MQILQLMRSINTYLAPSRKSDARQPGSGVVTVIQHSFHVRFSVENFAAQLDISM